MPGAHAPYTETARKTSYFVEMCERLGHPLIYLQDVSGFLVGPEAAWKHAPARGLARGLRARRLQEAAGPALR